jgi:hypothetical protein
VGSEVQYSSSLAFEISVHGLEKKIIFYEPKQK